MIRTFEDGDIVTSGVQFKTGKEATAQGIKHRLRLFLGEYFLDATEGTPWFQSILGKSSDGVAEISVKQRIITAPDVVGFTEFEFSRNAQERSIQVSASLIDVNNEQVKLLFQESV